MSSASFFPEQPMEFLKPTQEPDSPFVDEAFFVDKGSGVAQEWPSRVMERQFESPFQAVFEEEQEAFIGPENEALGEYDEAPDNGAFYEAFDEEMILTENFVDNEEEWEENEDVVDEFDELDDGLFSLSEEAIFEAEEDTGVFGNDDRKRVKNSASIPYRWICHITGRVTIDGARTNRRAIGTGVLISPRHVLTAAHILYHSVQDNRGLWRDRRIDIDSILVSPGQLSKNERPFGRVGVKDIALHPKWNPRTHLGRQYDIGILTLEKSIGDKTFRRLGNRPLGFFDRPYALLQRIPIKTLKSGMVYTAGYPKSRGGGLQMYATQGKIIAASMNSRLMVTSADATLGQSGSPVWMKHNGRLILVGIVIERGKFVNTAVRVTRELERLIRRWVLYRGQTKEFGVPFDDEEMEGENGFAEAFDDEFDRDQEYESDENEEMDESLDDLEELEAYGEFEDFEEPDDPPFSSDLLDREDELDEDEFEPAFPAGPDAMFEAEALEDEFETDGLLESERGTAIVEYKKALAYALKKLKTPHFSHPWYRGERNWYGGWKREPGKFDARYWERGVDPTGYYYDKQGRRTKHRWGVLNLRSGANPYDAIIAILAHPAKWSFDCATYVQAVHLYALAKSRGRRRINAFYARKRLRLRFHGSPGLRTIASYRKNTKNGPWIERMNGKRRERRIRDAKLLRSVPYGSRVMWHNIKGRGSFINENTVKVGADRYSGFPLWGAAPVKGWKIQMGLATYEIGSGREVRNTIYRATGTDVQNDDKLQKIWRYVHKNIYLREVVIIGPDPNV